MNRSIIQTLVFTMLASLLFMNYSIIRGEAIGFSSGSRASTSSGFSSGSKSSTSSGFSSGSKSSTSSGFSSGSKSSTSSGFSSGSKSSTSSGFSSGSKSSTSSGFSSGSKTNTSSGTKSNISVPKTTIPKTNDPNSNKWKSSTKQPSTPITNQSSKINTQQSISQNRSSQFSRYLLTAAGVYLILDRLDKRGNPIYLNPDTGERYDMEDIKKMDVKKISKEEFQNKSVQTEKSLCEEIRENIVGFIEWAIIILLFVLVKRHKRKKAAEE